MAKPFIDHASRRLDRGRSGGEVWFDRHRSYFASHSAWKSPSFFCRGHARGSASLGELDRHLARRLVDHLVAEHDGAALLDLGRVLVGLEERLGLVVLLLRRREHLVEHVDLTRVQRPLAVVTESSCAHRHLAEAVEVLDQADTDRRSTCKPVVARRDEDALEHVVPVVARIARHREPGGHGRKTERRAHVGGPEDQASPVAVRCMRDLVRCSSSPVAVSI